MTWQTGLKHERLRWLRRTLKWDWKRWFLKHFHDSWSIRPHPIKIVLTLDCWKIFWHFAVKFESDVYRRISVALKWKLILIEFNLQHLPFCSLLRACWFFHDSSYADLRLCLVENHFVHRYVGRSIQSECLARTLCLSDTLLFSVAFHWQLLYFNENY